jgi:hypothetical protein
MRGWVGMTAANPTCIAVSACGRRQAWGSTQQRNEWPGYRRRGFGEFITRYGTTPSPPRQPASPVLKALEPGNPQAGRDFVLYSRMGTRHGTRINGWASKMTERVPFHVTEAAGCIEAASSPAGKIAVLLDNVRSMLQRRPRSTARWMARARRNSILSGHKPAAVRAKFRHIEDRLGRRGMPIPWEHCVGPDPMVRQTARTRPRNRRARDARGRGGFSMIGCRGFPCVPHV